MHDKLWMTVQVTEAGDRVLVMVQCHRVGVDVCDRLWVTGTGDKTRVMVQVTVCARQVVGDRVHVTVQVTDNEGGRAQGVVRVTGSG